MRHARRGPACARGVRAAGLALLAIVALVQADAAQGCTGSGYRITLAQAWADGIAAFERGPLDQAQPELGLASHGEPSDALGPADGLGVVSLGDAGSLTAHVSGGIADGPGDDFAVYENGFWTVDDELFAEFAYVEVSSDGVHFARFDSATQNAQPVPAFGTVEPCEYQNLAGDVAVQEGTGFDLGELAGHPLVTGGLLDLEHVAYVRLIDVVGDGSTQDAAGQPIYDPYPTVFESGGFDVDAIGVLHAPEPAALPALLAGGGCLAWLRRRAARARPRPRPCVRHA